MKEQVNEVEQKVVTNSNLLFYLSDPDNDLLNLKLRKRAQALGNYFTNRLGGRLLSCFLFTLQLSYQQYQHVFSWFGIYTVTTTTTLHLLIHQTYFRISRQQLLPFKRSLRW